MHIFSSISVKLAAGRRRTLVPLCLSSMTLMRIYISCISVKLPAGGRQTCKVQQKVVLKIIYAASVTSSIVCITYNQFLQRRRGSCSVVITRSYLHPSMPTCQQQCFFRLISFQWNLRLHKRNGWCMDDASAALENYASLLSE